MNRAGSAGGLLKKKLEKQGHLMESVWISVNPETELPEGQGTYSVIVVMVMQTRFYVDPDLLEEAVRLSGQLQEAFARCNGIEIHDVKVIAESELSLEDLRFLTRWDYQDYLSGRPGQSEGSPAS